MESKVCIKCNLEKPIASFYFHTPGGNRRNVCGSCSKGYKTVRSAESQKVLELFSKGYKHCSKCDRILTVDSFGNDNKSKKSLTGLTSYCKACKRVSFQKHWGNVMKKNYGINKEEYDAMLTLQGFKCSICGTDKPSKRDRSFYVDHNHVTGKVRGLLCHKCNTSLAGFRENPAILIEAAKYLVDNE